MMKCIVHNRAVLCIHEYEAICDPSIFDKKAPFAVKFASFITMVIIKKKGKNNLT